MQQTIKESRVAPKRGGEDCAVDNARRKAEDCAKCKVVRKKGEMKIFSYLLETGASMILTMRGPEEMQQLERSRTGRGLPCRALVRVVERR